MQTLFYGHACLKVTGNRQSILMDPWFSPDGAFFKSWFQFPRNDHLLDEALQGVSAICISHDHADHLDPFTLNYALSQNASLAIHLPKHRSSWLRQRVANLLPASGERIVEHLSYDSFKLATGLSAFFVTEDSPEQFDSAIVCMSKDECLVNLNDARLTPDQLQAILSQVGTVDYLALQASGASEYPISHVCDAETMRRVSLQKRQSKLEFCLRTIDILKPKRVLFFAGPPVFLDRDLLHLNNLGECSIFPDQLAVLREISIAQPRVAAKAYFLLPGERLSDDKLWRETAPDDPRLLPYIEKEAYLRDYAAIRQEATTYDWGEPPDSPVLIDHFTAMVLTSAAITERIGGSVTFIIQVRAERKAYTVDFVARQVREGAVANPLYEITVPASAMHSILQGEANWEELFLSMRCKFNERRNRFVPQLKLLLKYMDADVLAQCHEYNLAQAQAQDSEAAMMDVTIGGATIKIQRFCPHANVDLSQFGVIDANGVITCLAHRLSFDLETGSCINSCGYSLRTRTG